MSWVVQGPPDEAMDALLAEEEAKTAWVRALGDVEQARPGWERVTSRAADGIPPAIGTPDAEADERAAEAWIAAREVESAARAAWKASIEATKRAVRARADRMRNA